MNNEFKVKKFKSATVYVLESATGGGTSAGGIATTPMCGMVKRSQVGSLFGGTYQQPKKSKAKKK